MVKSNLDTASLDDIYRRLGGIEDSLTRLHVDITKLKARAGFWGGAGAALVVLAYQILGGL